MPSELARVLARLSVTADKQVIHEPEFSEANNLEQQAKGLTDYAKNQESGIDAVWIISAASKLLSQAKALKENNQ